MSPSVERHAIRSLFPASTIDKPWPILALETTDADEREPEGRPEDEHGGPQPVKLASLDALRTAERLMIKPATRELLRTSPSRRFGE
jgi:hypothetical protein